jgi:hypothetical protein
VRCKVFYCDATFAVLCWVNLAAMSSTAVIAVSPGSTHGGGFQETAHQDTATRGHSDMPEAQVTSKPKTKPMPYTESP